MAQIICLRENGVRSTLSGMICNILILLSNRDEHQGKTSEIQGLFDFGLRGYLESKYLPRADEWTSDNVRKQPSFEKDTFGGAHLGPTRFVYTVHLKHPLGDMLGAVAQMAAVIYRRLELLLRYTVHACSMYGYQKNHLDGNRRLRAPGAGEKGPSKESFSRVIRRVLSERPVLTAGDLIDATKAFEGRGAGPRRRRSCDAAAASLRKVLPLVEFLAPLRVVTLSRTIAWRTAALQSSLSRRLGENDAWIAATAISYEATLVGREKAFERVPRRDYLSF